MLIWLEQIIRSFFFTIDNSMFSFIETLYNLLILLSRTTILTHSDIKEFAERIQVLLGVFMLFKVSFSIITYVINPDEFSDKSKGFAKLGQNIIISLVLLVVTPYLFGWAYDLQVIILEDNAIPNLLFSSKNDYNFIDNGGQRLSFSVMLPFFRPDTGLSELSSCYQLYETSDPNKFNSLCKEQLEAIVNDGKDDDLDARVINNYTTGVEYRNYGLTFRQEAATFLTNNNQFVFRYWIILSTAAAIVVILLLITFAMDIALRSVKLAFLQLIAPIPIISYIDPKQGKDGMFKKWYTMCFSTYVSLFVRLLALYFGFYLIDIVVSRGFSDVITGKKSQWGWFTTGMWINLFMIIGILMFVKQLPKILEGFGIKLDGGGKFTLNPFKKFEEEAIGGKKIMGASKGLAAGLTTGVVGAATGAGKARPFSAAFSGFKEGLKGKKINEIRKDQAQKNAVMRRAIASGSSWGERMEARFSSFFGASGRLGQIEHNRMDKQNQLENLNVKKQNLNDTIAVKKREQSGLKSTADAADSLKSRAESKIEEGTTDASRKYLNKKHAYEILKDKGITENRAATDLEIQQAENKLNALKKGKIKKRDATQSEILNAKQTLDNLRAGKTSSGLFVSNVDPHSILDAQKKYDDLVKNGVEEIEHYSQAEIQAAEDELINLKTNGVSVTRKATEEELTRAQAEMVNQKKLSIFDYVTSSLNGQIDDKLLSDDLFENFISKAKLSGNAIVDENTGRLKAIIKDGKEINVLNSDGTYNSNLTGKLLDDLAGELKGRVDEIQRNDIEAVERDIQKLSDEAAKLEGEIKQINRQKEDAKASIEAVHGIDPGPTNPKGITQTETSAGYREGGFGSGIAPAQTGFGGMPPHRGPHNDGGNTPPPPPPGGPGTP